MNSQSQNKTHLNNSFVVNNKKKRSSLIVSTMALGLVFLFAFSPFVASAQAKSLLSFGTIQNLTKNSGTAASTAPVVATVGSYVYVAWEEKPASGHVVTEFRASSNGGTSWGSIIVFSGLSGGANTNLDAVQIAASGTYVYLTWKQGGATAFAASSDNGATFHCGSKSGACIVSTGEPTGKDTAEAISANGANAYITWNDQTSTSALIEEVTTNDGGVTFSPITNLNTGASAGGFAAEDESAAVGSYVYVVWDSIWFSANSNYGNPADWTSPIQLHPPYCTSGCLSREPMISATGNNVYVTFPNDNGSTSGSTGNYNTYIAVSHDNGATWLNDNGPGTCVPGSSGCNPAHDLSQPSLSNTREVQVASYGSDVVVTSRGTASGVKGTQQYAYVSTNNGATFTPPILLGALPGSESGFGGVKIDQTNGQAYVYWPHGSPSQLYVSTCALATGPCTSLGSSAGQWSSSPQQVSKSTAGIVLLGDPGGSQGPMLAANNGVAYFVWEDKSTGNGDIYFTSTT
jgi:hypothetical protein